MMRIERFSPLTEATYYILLSLFQPLHGYGIMKKVESMSEGRVKLAAGTLYGALNKLSQNKLIESVGEDAENPKRKLYRITADGQELLRYEVGRLGEMYDNGLKEMGFER
jgi:DNA-binding PadR family transcriptional regulator